MASHIFMCENQPEHWECTLWFVHQNIHALWYTDLLKLGTEVHEKSSLH